MGHRNSSSATHQKPADTASGTHEPDVPVGTNQPQESRADVSPEQKPLGFLRVLVILVSSHIGVRSRANREEDFRRANGLHIFIAAVAYFLMIIGALIFLVNVIVGH